MPGARVQRAGLAGWLSRDPRAGPRTGGHPGYRRIVIRWSTRSRSPNTVSLATRSASPRRGVTWLAAARGSQTPPRSARPTTGPGRSPQAGARTLVDGSCARPASSVTAGLRSGERPRGNRRPPTSAHRPAVRPARRAARGRRCGHCGPGGTRPWHAAGAARRDGRTCSWRWQPAATAGPRRTVLRSRAAGRIADSPGSRLGIRTGPGSSVLLGEGSPRAAAGGGPVAFGGAGPDARWRRGRGAGPLRGKVRHVAFGCLLCRQGDGTDGRGGHCGWRGPCPRQASG